MTVLRTSVIIACIAAAIVFPQAARTAESIQRPLVLIPGILGSKLCGQSGEVVWGTGRSLSNFTRLQLNVSHPEKLEPCGLIDKIEILGPLYSINAYKALLDHLRSIGFIENKNLFLFDYDWRLSNYDNARKLKEFIAARQAEGKLPGRFDIIAHSMGGIVARIYLNENLDNRVNKIIYFGAPFLGAANTLGTLSEGWGSFSNWLAGGMDKIREVTVSFPGFLELLPRYNRCCYVRDTDGTRRDIDIFDANEWKALNWLPSRVHNDPALFSAFKAALDRSKNLTPLLRTVPPNLLEVKFAGDAHLTRTYFAVKAGATAPSSDAWYFTQDKGDGTVPVWSAACDESFSSLAGTLVSFAEHATLFDDKWAGDELEHELVAITPIKREPISGRGHPVISALTVAGQRNWTIVSMQLANVEASYRADARLQANATVMLDGPEQGLRSGLADPTAIVRTNSGVHRVSLQEITSANDLALRQLVFRLEIDLAAVEDGNAELEFSLPAVRDDAKAISRFAIISTR